MADTPSIVIVIPTYNERENLERLVAAIFRLPIPNLRILIVDDNSPDGTGELAEELSRKFPLSVIHRESKQGLGTAYAAAFKKILSEMPEAEFIFEMDADFSHDPITIPELLKTAQSCDLTIGSRYVKGGAIRNWNWFRRALSYGGNLYARLVLRVPYRDLTSGFKCYRRRVLQSIDLNLLDSVGYNFQIETIYKTHRAGFKIREIPITFTERREGKSKMHLAIVLESFFKVLVLPWRK